MTVKAGDRPVAIAVDALREQQEIVMKTLGSYIGQADNIAGASILGDGQVVLILDVASLVREGEDGTGFRKLSTNFYQTEGSAAPTVRQRMAA